MFDWNLSNLFDDTHKCLIILNCPIQHWNLFKQIWDAGGFRAPCYDFNSSKSASIRICVDGGANRLLEAASAHADPLQYTPNILVGDFDSLTTSTKDFYAKLNVDIFHDPDQYSTDYMKAFKHVPVDYMVSRCVSAENHPLKTHQAVTFGGLSGRLDQTVHTLSYTRSEQKKRDKAVYIVSENNIAWSMCPGTHHVRADIDKFGECCGILPIATKWAKVSTKGLEWDLGGPGLEVTGFDGMISSSNHLNKDVVEVSTDEFIYFNVEIRDSLLS